MPQRYLEVSGFVLAGGASRRMGRPKPALVLGGETLLARQVRMLRAVSRNVTVIGPAAGSESLEAGLRSLASPDVPVILDRLPGHGPLGGIYTGLARTRTEFNLFIGCDLPFMEARFLRFLCGRALRSAADATVPESRGLRIQPLVAVYRRRAVRAVRASLDRGDNKVTSFYPHLRCLIVRWPEIARAGFSTRIFDNINTPEDYQRALRRLRASSVKT